MKYVYGSPRTGESPSRGFDCSGFIKFVLSTAGLIIPDFIGADNIRRPVRHANEFWDHFGVAIDGECRSPGDLIFFSKKGDFPTHIGIVIDPETYIHAPGKDNTNVELANIMHEEIPRIAERNQIYRINPIGFKTPTLPLQGSTYRYHQELIT